ncbi:MAG: hypothetical protein V5A34_04945 [Halapricum sp.]
MRRIYDSEALYRDDDEPGAPSERRRQSRPQAIRWINSRSWSQRLVPNWLRYRAISISIETPRSEYAVGDHVPFEVRMKNAMPFPITIATQSPLLWFWDVDGVREAVRADTRDPPSNARQFTFSRGERKSFRKRWDGMFQVTDDEWEQADPGEYTIGARLNIADAPAKGLETETTIQLTR